MIVSTSPSPSFQNEVQTLCREPGWEAACLQCRCVSARVRSPLYPLNQTLHFQGLVKEKKNQGGKAPAVSREEQQLCVPAMISLLNTWSSFTLALSPVEIIIHHSPRCCAFRKNPEWARAPEQRRCWSLPDGCGFHAIYIWLAGRRVSHATATEQRRLHAKQRWQKIGER